MRVLVTGGAGLPGSNRADRGLPAGRAVDAGPSSAYGDSEVVPKVEGMCANPLSPHARHKHLGERCEADVVRASRAAARGPGGAA